MIVQTIENIAAIAGSQAAMVANTMLIDKASPRCLMVSWWFIGLGWVGRKKAAGQAAVI